MGSTSFQGRGFFGIAEQGGDIASEWDRSELTDALRLTREDERSGTSALLVGFYDPDEPEKGLGEVNEVRQFAKQLGNAIEEEFWPLLTRERLRVRVEVIDDDRVVYEHTVDPAMQYTELANALRKFDAGKVDGHLDAPGSVVVRDVPIQVSKRTDADEQHPAFEHLAKLVVTLSDDQPDSLENKVCLFRKPEMVVQTIDKVFEGRTYHAFLLAGGAIRPDNPSLDETRADDFLRFAEPPAHDQWIPRSGRNQTSQANLTAHYRAPWVPNLRNIEKGVLDQLFSLFGAPARCRRRAAQGNLQQSGLSAGRLGYGRAWRIGATKAGHSHSAGSSGRWRLGIDVRHPCEEPTRGLGRGAEAGIRRP